jgi:DNA-damage-inducible protein D
VGETKIKSARKKELIANLFFQFEQACHDYKGIECWSAHELQNVFSYSEWRNFLKVIDKAKGAGENTANHFVDLNKMVGLGSGSHREIGDIALTRYA